MKHLLACLLATAMAIASVVVQSAGQAAGAYKTGSFNQTSNDPSTGNNQFWMADREWDHRTSLIVDPPDGQFPPLTPEGEARRARGRRPPVTEASESAPRGRADGPEDRSPSERCISHGAPRTQANYNSNVRIVQSPKTVVLLQEMIHNARIMHMDGRPHPRPHPRQLHGDSPGCWEGDTLVVETSNYINGFQGSRRT